MPRSFSIEYLEDGIRFDDPAGGRLPLALALAQDLCRHARLRYQRPYADMTAAYRWLPGTWLPRSGHEPDDAPMFEAYLNSPQQVPPTELITDIHLPLRP